MDDSATSDFDIGFDHGTGYGFVLANEALKEVDEGTRSPTAEPLTESPTVSPSDSPTNSPSDSPTLTPTPGPTTSSPTEAPQCFLDSFCFSETTTVDVFGKGRIPMKELQVGDKIYTGADNGYEAVYGFGHRDETAVAEFMVFHTSSDSGQDLSPLEATKDHMILVNNTFLPAKYIQVGDLLHGADGRLLTVSDLHQAYKVGLYAPLTASGTLIANGVQVSSYVSLQKGLPKDWEHGFDLVLGMISQHQAVHILASPVRVVCLGGIFRQLCSNDYIDPQTGVPPHVRLAIWLVKLFDESNSVVQLLLVLLFVLICGSLYCIELMVGPASVPAFFASVFLGIVAIRHGLHLATNRAK